MADDIRGTDIRQASEQGLMDMASLISRGDYNLALVKGRQVAEQLVRGYAKENRLIYTDLADTIENLYGENTIGRGSRDAFHTIRQLGNKAVHENDNDPKDAEDSYYLLKNEIEVYLNTEAGTKNRAPVNVSRAGQAGGQKSAYNDEAADIKFTKPAMAVMGDPSGKLRTEVEPGSGSRKTSSQEQKQRKGSSDRSAQGRKAQDKRSKVPTREDRLKAQKQNRRGGQHRGIRNGGIDIYSVLRILIPVICIVLIIVLLRSCIAGSGAEETTTTPVVETSTAPVETEPPTTEAPTTAAPLRYVVTGNNVNVRYADNQNRIYEQLSSGTEIGEVQEIEGSDYVRFERDGIQLVIHKDYIAPIEN